MPYLQLDVNGHFAPGTKKRLASAMCDTYSRLMSVDIRRVTVAIRELGEGALWRVTCLGDEPVSVALLMLDNRKGRSADLRMKVAKALSAHCVGILDVSEDRLNVEFAQHSGDEMYHPALGGFSPEWESGERQVEIASKFCRDLGHQAEKTMPTYAFTSTKAFSPAQRERIVESVTAIHAAEATAPRKSVESHEHASLAQRLVPLFINKQTWMEIWSNRLVLGGNFRFWDTPTVAVPSQRIQRLLIRRLAIGTTASHYEQTFVDQLTAPHILSTQKAPPARAYARDGRTRAPPSQLGLGLN